MHCALEPMPCIKMKIEKMQFENGEVSSMNSFLTILLMALFLSLVTLFTVQCNKVNLLFEEKNLGRKGLEN